MSRKQYSACLSSHVRRHVSWPPRQLKIFEFHRTCGAETVGSDEILRPAPLRFPHFPPLFRNILVGATRGRGGGRGRRDFCACGGRRGEHKTSHDAMYSFFAPLLSPQTGNCQRIVTTRNRNQQKKAVITWTLNGLRMCTTEISQYMQ